MAQSSCIDTFLQEEGRDNLEALFNVSQTRQVNLLGHGQRASLPQTSADIYEGARNARLHPAA